MLSARIVHGKRHKRGTLDTYHGKVLVSGDKCVAERNVLSQHYLLVPNIIPAGQSLR